MADAIYAGGNAHHKTNPMLPAGLSPANCLEAVHPGIVGTALVSPDERGAGFARLDEQGGSAAFGECVAALPDHRRPVAALIALAEAGIVRRAPDAAFAATGVVRRLAPSRA